MHFSIGQLRHRDARPSTAPQQARFPNPEGTPLNADPAWGVSPHLEQQAGDPFHQQVPRRSWPTNGGRRELPGEGVWLMQLAGALYQGGKDGSPPVVTVWSFFVFFFVWIQDNSGPDETRFRASGLQQFPVKQKPFKVNKQVSANGKKEIHALKLH